MTYTIPSLPDALVVRVDRLWNGEACPDDRLWAEFKIAKTKEGLNLHVRGPLVYEQRVPDAPIGSRVEKLWEYDVAELFLVGPGHRYLEVELGAGGHWLVLDFDSIRHRSSSCETFQPLVRFEKTSEKHWISEMTIPWGMIPENLRAFNAFAIMGGQFLALSALPGDKPDFHQPDAYPKINDEVLSFIQY